MMYQIQQVPLVGMKREDLMQPGTKFFIDIPKRVAGKMIFDGQYFLAERCYYTVTGIKFTSTGPTEDVYRIFSRKIKIRPTGWRTGQVPFYCMWGRRQRRLNDWKIGGQLPAQGTTHQ